MRATLTLVGAMVLASCSMVVVQKRVRDHQRPSRADYEAPIVESTIAVAAIVATVFVARAEAAAEQPDVVCTQGFLGETTCTGGHREFGGTIILSVTALASSISALYGWVKIPAMRNASIGDD